MMCAGIAIVDTSLVGVSSCHRYYSSYHLDTFFQNANTINDISKSDWCIEGKEIGKADVSCEKLTRR